MIIFELTIGLLLAGIVMQRVAERVGAPYPIFLAIGGAGLALLPGLPVVPIDPSLILVLGVAPILLDAAYDTSLRDLRDNWRPIATAVFVTVGLTVVAVALVARWLVPEMPWAVAVTLGAIVAPPDAASAVAVLRVVRPPRRIQVILEGESLLNDASALLIYRVGVAAAAGSWGGWAETPGLALAAIGGAAFGFAAGRVVPRLMQLAGGGAGSILMQFLGTFLVWGVAESLDLSPILTVVVYGMTLAHRPSNSRARAVLTPELSPELRVRSYAVWDVVTFTLNVLIFVAVGMQLQPILARMQDADWQRDLMIAGAVLATVMLVRIAWTMSYNAAIRTKNRFLGPSLRRKMMLPTVGSGLVISWCGMRGVVTLAAALALPQGETPFPYRDLILVSAFVVVLGTLVVQGLTLAPLLRVLGLSGDTALDEELALARRRVAEAALGTLDPQSDKEPIKMLRSEYELRRCIGIADGQPSPAMRAEIDTAMKAHRDALTAERAALDRLRHEGEIGDETYHAVEEELDWTDMYLDRRMGQL